MLSSLLYVVSVLQCCQVPLHDIDGKWLVFHSTILLLTMCSIGVIAGRFTSLMDPLLVSHYMHCDLCAVQLLFVSTDLAAVALCMTATMLVLRDRQSDECMLAC